MSDERDDARAPESFMEAQQMTKEERRKRLRERAKEKKREEMETVGKAEELGARSRAADGEEDPLAKAAHRDLSDTITVFDEKGPGVDLEILPVDPDRGIELGAKATAMQNAIAKLDEKAEAELSDEDLEKVKELKAEVADVFEEVTRDPKYDVAYVYDQQAGLHIAIEVLNAIQKRAAEEKEEEAEEAKGFR